MNYIKKAPILCIAYNRLDHSKLLFDKLFDLGCKEIYLSIDGSKNEEDSLIAKSIIDYARFKFPSVLLNKLKSNMGVRFGPYEGINWFFSKVKFGIILEDDCIPNSDFFRFIYEMYSRYKDHNNILTIAGGNFSSCLKNHKESYYFSAYVNIWGWATWRSKWNLYRNTISKDDVDKLNKEYKWYSKKEKKYFINKMNPEKLDSWDFQLSFLSFKEGYLNITPRETLIQNIGFIESTHKFLADPVREKPSTSFKEKSFIHPEIIELNRELDYAIFKETKSYSLRRILRVLKSNSIKRLASFTFFKLKQKFLLK